MSSSPLSSAPPMNRGFFLFLHKGVPFSGQTRNMCVTDRGLTWQPQTQWTSPELTEGDAALSLIPTEQSPRHRSWVCGLRKTQS